MFTERNCQANLQSFSGIQWCWRYVYRNGTSFLIACAVDVRHLGDGLLPCLAQTACLPRGLYVVPMFLLFVSLFLTVLLEGNYFRMYYTNINQIFKISRYMGTDYHPTFVLWSLMAGHCYGNKVFRWIGQNWHITPSFIAVAFHSGLEDHNGDGQFNTGDNPPHRIEIWWAWSQ